MKWTIELCAGALVAAASAGPVAAQAISLESVTTGGMQGNEASFGGVISDDGRFVAFWSYAYDLVPGDGNATIDIFVRDRVSGATERVSVDSSGLEGNDSSYGPSISSDGRFVAFVSTATNLVPGDTNAGWDIFLRDRQAGTTIRANVGSNGEEANANSTEPRISPDGRYLVFSSFASTLVPGDTNGTWDVFVRDLSLGTTTRVSLDSNGLQANSSSIEPAISADGRYVAFSSLATNLVPGDVNNRQDVFLRDLASGTTSLVSVRSDGAQANHISSGASLSGDGSFVAFESRATNLTAEATGPFVEVFLRDVVGGTTTLVSIDGIGLEANNTSRGASISADGRTVAFTSLAGNIVPGDGNHDGDVFVRDMLAGATRRVSVNERVEEGNARSGMNNAGVPNVSMSPDARYVAFGSNATNLVHGDANGFTDVFVHERPAVGFSSHCDPGVVGGAIECPCSNPPAGAGRGCDNSSVTGGAVLAARGIASLAHDSLVFTTNSEKPTALSVVMQGTAGLVNGAVYGQGVRCVGGAPLCRLFTKQASGGSITAPDFGAGDPTVSARSAAKGNPIHAGETRWYLVYYRDPIVLDLCPPTSTFNATQTGEVDWSM
jgi:Tol biopolymer transport system component